MQSLSHDTKLKLKDLFVCLAHEEVKIEKLRQVLASIPDFEPYAAFKRIDRLSTGYLTCKTICKYLRENGYRELEKEDITGLVRYFDSDEDMKLSFHDFLQILLPCDDAILRADASQRPTFKIGKTDVLPVCVERALTTLLLREVKLQIKAENIKRIIEGSYDFNIQAAFKVIDDWSYGYIDARNLRRFLRNMGVLLTKHELIALIRRIDLDGDAKISYEEFYDGVRSQFAQANKIGQQLKAKGVLSTHNGNTSKMVKNHSRSDLITTTPKKNYNFTPNKRQTPIKTVCNKRPKSAEKTSIRAKQLLRSFAKKQCPCDYHNNAQPYFQRQRPSINNVNQDLGDNTYRSTNKSVTFNKEVKVTEYESISKQQDLQNQYERVNQSPFSNQNPISECKRLAAMENPYLHDQYQSVSPLRHKTSQSITYNNDLSSNRNYLSPSLQQQDRIISSPLRQNSSSPLKLIDPRVQRTLHYNYTPEKNTSFSCFSEKLKDDKFDRIEQEQCVKLIKDIIFIERELESCKIELALKPDFNLLDAFKMIDLNNMGWVTYQDMSQNLYQILDIDTLSDQVQQNLKLFLRRYDTNRDGRLSLAEFCKAFTPIGKEYASLVQGRAEFYSRKGINPRDYFNTETRRYIKNLWSTLLYTERQIENLRQQISQRSLFNLRSAFKYFDQTDDGILNITDFRETLANNGFFATDKELQLIMNKFDKFSDMKITLTDFIEELAPRSNFQ